MHHLLVTQKSKTMLINIYKVTLFKRVTFLFYLILFIVLNSCSYNKNTSKLLEIKLDTIRIPITSSESIYYGASTLQGDDYIGYNFNTKTIDVFSLESKSLKYKVEQNIGGGPNEIRELHNLFSFGKDSLMLISSNSFAYRTMNDSIYKRVDFSSKDHGIWSKNLPKFQVLDLYYRPKGKDYILINGSGRNYDKIKEPNLYYNNTLPFMKYYIENDSLASLNITYPIEYSENYYSFRDASSAVMINDSLFFNFSAIPKIFIQNLKDSSFSEIPIPINEIDSYTEPSIPFQTSNDINKLMSYNAALPSFGKLHKVGDYLICIYKNGSRDRLDNPWEDPKLKSFALIFKNNNFIKSVEILKGPSTALRTFNYKNGILIPIGAQENENFLNLLHLTIN